MARSECWWYKFEPRRWSVFTSEHNATAGKRFKQLIIRLLSGDAPEGSEERRMLDEAAEYSAKQRMRIQKRYTKPRPPGRDPGIAAVYAFADENGIDGDTAHEWYEWQTQKGWKDVKVWKAAFKAFADKKQKQRGQQ